MEVMEKTGKSKENKQPTGKQLREEIFIVIKKNWPIHVSGVCRHLAIEDNASNISKLVYHFNQLKKEDKIHTKRIDRALLAWPLEIEKLRVMRDFFE